MQLVTSKKYIEELSVKYSDVDKKTIQYIVEFGMKKIAKDLQKGYDYYFSRGRTFIKVYSYKKNKRQCSKQYIDKCRINSNIDITKPQEWYYIPNKNNTKYQIVYVLEQEAKQDGGEAYRVKVENPTLNEWNFYCETVELI